MHDIYISLYLCKANKYYVIILFVMRIIDVITIGTIKYIVAF